MALLPFLLGFLIGALALAALEAAALLLLLRRLRRRKAAPEDAPPAADELPGERPFPYEKQVSGGAAFVLLLRLAQLSLRFGSVRSLVSALSLGHPRPWG